MEKKAFQKRMVTTIEAASLFSTSPGTLMNWRSLKRGPKFYRVSRKILYRLEDLESFFTREPVLTVDSLPEAR